MKTPRLSSPLINKEMKGRRFQAHNWALIISLLVNWPLQLAQAAPATSGHADSNAIESQKTSQTAGNGHQRAAKHLTLADLTKPIKRTFKFSNNPSDIEIANARIFPEPLVPMNGKYLPAENAALAKALFMFKSKNDFEGISALKSFLIHYPNSRWRPSLETNLGQISFETGYLTDALKYWQSAWKESKDQILPAPKAVADRAIANMVLLEAQLGLMPSLQKHLAEIAKRPLTGSNEQKVKNAHNGLWSMKHSPKTAFKCGPFALNTLLTLKYPNKPIGCDVTIRKAPSTAKGTNLVQLIDWSKQIGLKLQMAKRSTGAKIIVPSIMHWKVGHYCAITECKDERYHIQDPTFGEQGNLWISAKAIESESDGYFLIPQAPLPPGWKTVSKSEGQTIWGKGNASSQDDSKSPNTPKNCTPPNCCGSGMAVASAFSMNATLNIVDYPLSYTPPIGPPITFGINYNYNEGNQPSTFTFTNLGQDWSINWLSYLTVDGSNNATVRVRGGGYEIYNYTGSSTYSPNLTSQAQMINWGSNVWQRTLPDGSSEYFSLSDGTNTYMTFVVDPQGNTANINYDANYRITSIVDAANNAPTTFAYVSNTLGNPGFYKLASITDGFGRTASFAYDSTVTFLTSITDAAGNVSKFAYDPSSSFINLLTTPYGTTGFYQYTPTGGNPSYPPTGLKFLFPDGSTSIIENWIGEQKETYYWDREATAAYPNDPVNHNYSHCTSTRWLWEQATNSQAPVASWTRHALEAPVIYSYPGESYQDFCGTSNKPTQIAKQLVGFRNTATIGGTVTAGDVLGIRVIDGYLPFNDDIGSEYVYYTVQSGDTLTSIAAGFAAAINADYSLQAFGITATSSSSVVTITSQSINSTSFSNASSGSPTETITFASGPNQAEMVTLGGTATSGDTLTIIANDAALPGGQETVTYTVQTGDTLATIAQALSNAICADTNLQALNVIAIWNANYGDSPYLEIQSSSTNSTTYTSSTSGGATETITLSASTNGIFQASNYQRNTLGYITQSIDQNGRELQYNYASNNIDLLNIQSPASPQNFLLGQWVYNANHRPLFYTDGSGQRSQYKYNSYNEPSTIIDPQGNISTLSYDLYGYLTQIRGPLAGNADITNFNFYGYGPLHTVTDSEGYTLTYSYDNLNRLTNVTYPDGTSDQTIYDRLDAVLRCDRLGRWTQDAYDSLDQLSYEVDPLGRKTNYCWCICGALASLTDPAGHTTTWSRDLEGRVTLKMYADGTSTSYAYEPIAGRLLSKTDALNQTTTYNYNLDNTVQYVKYSNAVNATSPVAISYDTAFTRTSSISNNWGAYTYSYNPYYTTGSAITGGGRLASVTNNVIANSAVTYTYDVLGRTTNRSINSSSNSTTWTYDALSRITQEVNPLGTFGYNYLNDTSGSSKGDLRLSSINYPNSQTTNFNWLPNIGDQRLQQIANLNPSSATLSQFNYAYNSAGEITQWQQQQNSTNIHLGLGYDLASQLTSANSDSGSAFNAYISGTPHTGDVVSITAYDASLTGTTPPGQETASYTVVGGDTSSTIASSLASNIASTMSNISVTASATGSIISISTSPNYATQFTVAVSGAGATDTISISPNSSSIQPLHKQLYYAYDCASNRIGVQGDSTGSFPTGLTTTATQYTYNNVNELTAASAGGPIRFKGTTVNPIKSAVINMTQAATLSGTVTPGDVLTISVHDKALSQAENVSYTVVSGNTTTSIATGLKNAINADTTLSSVGVTATSSGAVVTISSSSINNTKYTQAVSSGATETITFGGSYGSVAKVSPSNTFKGNAVLAVGANTASITAVSGGGTATTNTYPITISSAASQSLTYDDNGNTTSDGTNSYAWNAENRLIKITYPGSGNNSQFTYDALGHCIQIVETSGGSITNTKQFVWCGNKMCEARDAGSTITAQYFSQGETISGTNYYYTKDHLGSISEITNGAGTIQSQYSYDPYGQVTKIAGSGPDADFQYAGYYYHAPSGLNLTVNRAYNASLGRWINRDPIEEAGGINLFAYVNNDPIDFTDINGTDKSNCSNPPKPKQPMPAPSSRPSWWPKDWNWPPQWPWNSNKPVDSNTSFPGIKPGQSIGQPPVNSPNNPSQNGGIPIYPPSDPAYGTNKYGGPPPPDPSDTNQINDWNRWQSDHGQATSDIQNRNLNQIENGVNYYYGHGGK